MTQTKQNVSAVVRRQYPRSYYLFLREYSGKETFIRYDTLPNCKQKLREIAERNTKSEGSYMSSRNTVFTTGDDTWTILHAKELSDHQQYLFLLQAGYKSEVKDIFATRGIRHNEDGHYRKNGKFVSVETKHSTFELKNYI